MVKARVTAGPAIYPLTKMNEAPVPQTRNCGCHRKTLLFSESKYTPYACPAGSNQRSGASIHR